jgi:hypothetical protein
MKNIQNEIVKTKHIKQALEKFIAKHLIAPSETDFVLNKVDTLLKTPSEENYELCNKEMLPQYLDKEKILKEKISFTQIYTVTLQHIEKKEIELLYDIEYGKFSSHPKLILSPESKIPYQKYKPAELLGLLYKEINKIKAYNKMLLKIFDEDLKKALKMLVKYIYAKKFVKKVKSPFLMALNQLLPVKQNLFFGFCKKKKQAW